VLRRKAKANKETEERIEDSRRFEEGSGAKGKSENKRTKCIAEKSGFRI